MHFERAMPLTSAERSSSWRLRHPGYIGPRHANLCMVVDNLKRVPCMDCDGSFPPACMDFDHRDPASKVDGVTRMVNANLSLDRILAEIAKCDLVCANCHRIRTHGTSRRALTQSDDRL